MKRWLTSSSGPWSAVGLLVRDPATTNTGQKNWLMYKVGYQCNNGVQAAPVGTERKSTFNGQSLLRYGDGSHRARLRICRMDDTFRLFRMFEGQSEWQEARSNPGEKCGPGLTTGFARRTLCSTEGDSIRTAQSVRH